MWLACPASVTLTKTMTRPSSKFAKEGTAAHAVAEMTLKGDIFLPDKVSVEGDEFIVSPGMCRALNPYVSHVEALRALPGAEVVLEKRLIVPGTEGLVWGTIDCGVYFPGNIHVVDLKFGKGVAVEPDGPQLKFYALALAQHFNVWDSDVTLTICQPRVGGEPLRSHPTTVQDLLEWRVKDVAGHLCQARRRQDQGRRHDGSRGRALPLVRQKDSMRCIRQQAPDTRRFGVR